MWEGVSIAGEERKKERVFLLNLINLIKRRLDLDLDFWYGDDGGGRWKVMMGNGGRVLWV